MVANMVKGVSESFYLILDRVQYILILLCSILVGETLLTYQVRLLQQSTGNRKEIKVVFSCSIMSLLVFLNNSLVLIHIIGIN